VTPVESLQKQPVTPSLIKTTLESHMSPIPMGKPRPPGPRALLAQPLMLSIISGHRVEDVTAASAGPVYFQLYMLGGRAAAEAVIERALIRER
jgi:hypothetical protein